MSKIITCVGVYTLKKFSNFAGNITHRVRERKRQLGKFGHVPTRHVIVAAERLNLDLISFQVVRVVKQVKADALLIIGVCGGIRFFLTENRVREGNQRNRKLYSQERQKNGVRVRRYPGG